MYILVADVCHTACQFTLPLCHVIYHLCIRYFDVCSAALALAVHDCDEGRRLCALVLYSHRYSSLKVASRCAFRICDNML
jgi:hypothetical protein